MFYIKLLCLSVLLNPIMFFTNAMEKDPPQLLLTASSKDGDYEPFKVYMYGIKKFTDEDLKMIDELSPVGKKYPHTKKIDINLFLFGFTADEFYTNKDVKKSFFNYNIENEALEDFRNIHTYGFITIPTGEGPFPCAILCHGSEGFVGYLNQIQSLAKNGIASLTFNRFFSNFYKSELVFNTINDQFSISPQQEIISTLSAAMLMSTHPKIDKNKIGFIGWSRGGNVAIDCIKKDILEAIYPNFVPSFCIAYYAMPLIIKKEEIKAPLLCLHGEEDELTPFNKLMWWVNKISGENFVHKPFQVDKTTYKTANSGKNIKVIVYKKSGHAFDSEEKPPFQKQSFLETLFAYINSEEKWMNMKNCCVEESEDGNGFRSPYKPDKIYPWEKFPAYLEKHITWGATLGLNPEAGQDSWKECINFTLEATK